MEMVKVLFENDELRNGIAAVMTAASPDGTVQIRSANGGKVQIETSGGAFGIKKLVKASYNEDFSFCTTVSECRKMLGIPSDEVLLTVQETGAVRLSWPGSVRNCLYCRRTESEYFVPVRLPEDGSVQIQCSVQTFSRMADNILWLSKNQYEAVGADAVRLSFKTDENGESSMAIFSAEPRAILRRTEKAKVTVLRGTEKTGEFRIEMLGRHLSDILRVLNKDDRMIIFVSKDRLFFTSESVLIDVKRLANGTVSGTESLLDCKKTSFRLDAPKKDVLEALDMLRGFAYGEPETRLTMETDSSEGEGVVFGVSVPHGREIGSVRIPASFTGNIVSGFRTGFDMTLFSNIVKAFPDDDISIEGTEPAKPFWFEKTDANGSATALLAPIILR